MSDGIIALEFSNWTTPKSVKQYHPAVLTSSMINLNLTSFQYLAISTKSHLKALEPGYQMPPLSQKTSTLPTAFAWITFHDEFMRLVAFPFQTYFSAFPLHCTNSASIFLILKTEPSFRKSQLILNIA